MNDSNSSPGLPIRAVLWGFVAGLPVGIILGWSMHGLVGVILRVMLFVVCVIVVIGVGIAWRGNRKSGSRGGARGDIVDVSWRDPGAPGGGSA